jgi:putative ABC transport system permease protein
MKLIAGWREYVQRLAARLVYPRNAGRGADIIADVRELYAERRTARGTLYALLRAGWDVTSILLRPAPPPRVTEPTSGRSLMARTIDDLRHALGAVVRRPLVSGTVAVTLGVGLGLAMLTFTIVDGVLIRPLTFPAGEDLLSIYSEFRPESGYTFSRFALSAPEVIDYQQQSRLVDVAAWQPATVSFGDGDGVPERVGAVRASSGIFRLLQTQPQVGRSLTAADDRPGTACVAVLSDGLWNERFGRRYDILGRKLAIAGEPCEVVGVMPPGFVFPGQTTRVWLPLHVDRNPDSRGNHGLVALGRLRNHASLADAQREAAALMARWAKENAHHRGHGVVIASLKDDLIGPVSQQLIVLGCAVGLVLLVIAANISSLLLTHGEARRRELALRAALGADRQSLVRQLGAEALLLSGTGGLLGGYLAWLCLEPALGAYPHVLPRASDIHFDLRVLAAGALITGGVGFLVGLVPAARLTRIDVSEALKAGERGQALPLTMRTHRWLMAGELGFSVAVMAGALLLAQSVRHLQEVPLGFDPSHATTVVIDLPSTSDRPPASVPQFFDALLGRVRGWPGMAAAGAISDLPLVGSPPPDDVMIEGRPVPQPTETGVNAHYVIATPGAFAALGIPIVSGRPIDARDTAGAPAVAVVNETAAQAFWPARDPVGQRIRYPTGVRNGQWAGWSEWLTVIGVAADVRFLGPSTPAQPAVYVAHAQQPRPQYEGRTMTLVVRTSKTTTDLAASLRSAVRQLDPQASVSRVQTMESVVGAALARPRFMGSLMSAFAVISLAVAALGVYGVVGYGVQRQTRDIGVRLALGATRGRIAWLVGRQTLPIAAGGLVCGLVGAAWLSQSMRSLLFGIGPFDMWTYTVVAAILGCAVIVAIAIPVCRAITVDPLVAIRAD